MKIAKLCFYSLSFRRKVKGYRQVVALAKGRCLSLYALYWVCLVTYFLRLATYNLSKLLPIEVSASFWKKIHYLFVCLVILNQMNNVKKHAPGFIIHGEIPDYISDGGGVFSCKFISQYFFTSSHFAILNMLLVAVFQHVSVVNSMQDFFVLSLFNTRFYFSSFFQ